MCSIESSKPFTFHEFEQIQWRHGVDVRIKYIPVGKNGLEIPYIYQLNSDGTAGKKYTAGTSAGVGTFKVLASARKITPPTDVKKEERALIVYEALLC